MPPPLPQAQQPDAGATQPAPDPSAETQGPDASGQPVAPVWPANMASHGALFAADGVVQTPAAAPQPARQQVEGTHAILYADFQCPHCGTFSAANDDALRALIDEGAITLELRPLSFVDPTNSLRHAAAFAAVVDEFPETAWAFQSALFANQRQGGLSDDELIELADSAGAQSPQLEERIRSGALLGFAQAASATGLSTPVEEGVPAPRGTPALYVDGAAYSGPLDVPQEVADFIASRQ